MIIDEAMTFKSSKTVSIGNWGENPKIFWILDFRNSYTLIRRYLSIYRYMYYIYCLLSI